MFRHIKINETFLNKLNHRHWTVSVPDRHKERSTGHSKGDPNSSGFLDEFRSKCNGKFDVSFTAREDSGEAAGKLKRLEQLERFAEMKILTPADGAKENYKLIIRYYYSEDPVYY